jgi:hypothetical protein
MATNDNPLAASSPVEVFGQLRFGLKNVDLKHDHIMDYLEGPINGRPPYRGDDPSDSLVIRLAARPLPAIIAY